MDVTLASPQQAADTVVAALGLGDSGADLFSPEALAMSLRRAASFQCPAAPSRIVQSVSEVLVGLPGWTEETRSDVQTMLTALVGHGDLLELPSASPSGGRRQVYLGAPAFIRRASGACLAIGVRPDGAPLISQDLAAVITYEGHMRIIRPSGTCAMAELLAAADLLEMTPEQWVKAPPAVPAAQVIREYVHRLAAAMPSGDTEGFRIIDPSAPAGYYRGRWRQPRATDNGQFVGRRPQAFGADLWCFAAVSGGQVRRIVGLPSGASTRPGADEAWRLQAAMDADAGHAQRVRVRVGPHSGVAVLDFLSPIPSWAQRRLDVIGTALVRSPRALFSYSIPQEDAGEELQFLRDMLWTAAEYPEGRGTDAR